MRFLEWLACPDCGGGIALARATEQEGEDVIAGELACRSCAKRFPIEGRVPCFVEPETYADNFGWQWKQFGRLQRDSYNQSGLVRATILKRSGWKPEDLAGRTVLECGCGSGSETEVLAELAGAVVAIDLSDGVHAMDPKVLARENVLALRADLRRAPLAPGRFDLVYCHRVIMHTPDPRAAFGVLTRHVKPGGSLFLHSYDTHWKSVCHFRYWMRPLIKGVRHETIFRALKAAGPVLYPVVGALNKVAILRRPTKLLVPFENHDRILAKAGAKLSPRERYEYSLLVTFDALTPEHDNPSSPQTVASWFSDAGFDVEIKSRNPVIALGRKRAEARAALEPAGSST